MGMFDWVLSVDDYDQRMVGRHEYEHGYISTARVLDGRQPYETAVCDDRYRDGGDMVIVEAYDTKAEAEAGHAKWVVTMTAGDAPHELTDCENAEMAAVFGLGDTYPRK
jgi:hypothetical protein